MSIVRWLCIALALGSPGAFALEPTIAVNVSRGDDGFVVDAVIDVAVPLRTAWAVLTDFDRMPAVLRNLTSSRIVKREGQTLTVRQEGRARYGLLSFSFESEREIRLEPMTRILVRQLSGTAKHMHSESRLSASESGTRLVYRAEIVPDSVLARLFGATFVRQEVAEQFRALAAEMVNRENLVGAPTSIPQ